MRFASRVTVETTKNRLTIAAEEARRTGELLDLTVSNPTTAAIPYDETAILAALASRRALVYEPEPLGLPSARAAVAREMGARGVHVTADRVLLTASTSEAYAFLFKLLCDAGDDVLVPRPSYPLFDVLAGLEGVTLTPYPLAYDGEWHVDLAALAAAVTPRTRAVLVVSPNNPTGSFLKRHELARIAALGLPIVSDEVFAGYPLRPDPARAETALLAEGGPLVFALGGLSKLAALPQMKAAWTVVGGPAPLARAALERLEWIADAFLSVGSPVMHALPGLLASRGAAEEAILARVRKNRALVARAASGSAATALDVEGGWTQVLRLPRVLDEEAWTLTFAAADRVLVQPGHFFDFPSEAYVVLSLLTPEETFAEGLRRLLARVAITAG